MEVRLPCMFGNIGETAESIKKTVNILLKHSPSEYRLLRPVTPYPGSPLYQYALDKGLLKDHEEFFQLSKNPDMLTVNFTEMNDEVFYQALFDANNVLINAYYEKVKENEKKAFHNMYFQGDDSGFRPNLHEN
jgi:radical SAM superfamily enzyme YgiQ (UPF0313 family)